MILSPSCIFNFSHSTGSFRSEYKYALVVHISLTFHSFNPPFTELFNKHVLF